MKYILCSDVIFYFRNGNCIASNPRSRSHVVIDSNLISLFEKNNGADENEWIKAFVNVKGYDRTNEYYGSDGLHGDPTGLTSCDEVEYSDKTLFDLLCKRWILVEEDYEQYNNYFNPLSSILDRSHLGTFHQRVGQYLTIKKRIKEERWKWWHNQKYTPDGKTLKDGPYKFVQEDYILKYFNNKKIKGLNVLDFGCGNGYYSAKLDSLGANVIGIDTSKELIEMAQSNFSTNIQFEYIKSPQDGIDFLHKHRDFFEIIFMQDVLLILLNPESGEDLLMLTELLQGLHTALKDNGMLYAVEPNGIFWLAGRYGDPNNPYAIVTEYRNPLFNVAPNLKHVISQMSNVGFYLKEYDHPEYNSDIEIDQNTKNYANNFSIWDFMGFVCDKSKK